MAAENGFPQLPLTVWKGVWGLLRKSPSRKLDEGILAIELHVQPAAARQYLSELVKIGILEADGQPTELAQLWRADGDDKDVIDKILAGSYPTALRDMAPADDLDRAKIVRWFMSQKVGEGSAKNKAATYIMLATPMSALDAPRASGATKAASDRQPTRTASRQKQADSSGDVSKAPPADAQVGPAKKGRPDLNINIQIHISADASVEQIDAIFAGMRRYFD